MKISWHQWVRGGLAALSLIACVAAACPASGAGARGYPLFFSFEIPLAAPGLRITDDGTQQTSSSQQTFSGTLRGTLGGLPIRAASYTYQLGKTKVVGGGTFTLETAAGAVRDGRVLVSVGDQRTTVLFFSTYLGGRLEFALTGDRPQIGGTGVVVRGLARTSFASHDDYAQAVRAAVASLPPGTRDEITAAADRNPILVSNFEQNGGTR